MKKILGVSTKGYPGASRVLRDLAGIGLADFTYLEELKSIPKADILILAAWHPAYQPIISKFNGRKYINWTSPPLQTELNDPEIEFLSFVVRHEEIDGIWFGSEQLAKAFGDRGFYLPYPVDINQIYQYKIDVEKKENIGLFTALYNKQKNVLNQLLAVKFLQEKKDIVLNTNGMTPTQKTFAEIIGLKYKDHGFLPGKQYFETIQKMRAQTHVFLSESWSYATVESLILGTPCLMSITVANNMGINNHDVIVRNVDDPSEIARKLENLMNRKDYNIFREQLRNIVLSTAEKHNSFLKAHLPTKF